MSRRTFHRYLLFYLFVSAILACGSSRRISRGASCPSCNQDHPEALVSPWYPQRGSNLQTQVQADFPIEDSPYFHAQRGFISQNIARDNNVLPNQDRSILENYRNFPRQESTRWYPYGDILPSRQFVNKPKEQNLFFDGLPSRYLQSLDSQRIFPQKESANRYALSPVLPSRQFFDKSGHENLSFRNIRNKYSKSKDQDSQDFTKDEEDPASKLLLVYRADRNPSRKISEDASSDIIPTQKSFRTFQQENISNEERNAIKKPTSSVSQYNFVFPQEGHYSTEFDMSDIDHDSHSIQKPMKNAEFFDNLDFITNKNPSTFPDLKQLKEMENDSLETYLGEEEMDIYEDNDEQNDYNPYTLNQNLNLWESIKDRESFDNWNIAARKDSQKIPAIGQSKINNNWPQMYPAPEEDMRYLKNDNRNKEYLRNENRKSVILTKDNDKLELTNYNPYSLSQDSNMWTTTNDKELRSHLNFTMNKNLQEPKKLESHALEQTDNKYFENEDKKDAAIESETQETGQIIRTPNISYNPYITSRYLNMLNAAKYSGEFPRTEKPIRAESSILHPEQEKDERSLNDKIIQNDSNQNLMNSKGAFNVERYSGSTGNIKSNTNKQEQVSTDLDPDLMDDIENPPAESTEPTSIKSS